MAPGELKIVASSDLGELGAKDGPPVTYFWPVTTLAPYIVPWLAVGLLLVLPKANRRLAAWWVLLPLLCAQALFLCLRPQLQFVSAEELDTFQQVFDALSFGIAAAWLVFPLFGRRSRIAAFLVVLLATGCMGLLAFVVRADWSTLLLENIICLVLLGLAVFWSALALSLAGLLCRRRLRPTPFSLCVLGVVVVGWCAPLLLVRIIGGRGKPLSGLVTGVFAFALVHFMILLPFLLLSFIHPFYRERLAPISGSAGS